MPNTGLFCMFFCDCLSVSFPPMRGSLITKGQNESLTWQKWSKSKNNCFPKVKALKCCQGGVLFYGNEILEVSAGRDTGSMPSFVSRFQYLRDISQGGTLCFSTRAAFLYLAPRSLNSKKMPLNICLNRETQVGKKQLSPLLSEMDHLIAFLPRSEHFFGKIITEMLIKC